MERGSEPGNMIAQAVRREIARVISETLDTVKEEVRAAFLHQLKMAIRDSIGEMVEDLLAEEMSQIHGENASGGEMDAAPASSGRMMDEVLASFSGFEDKPVVDKGKRDGDGDGRYVYCIAECGESVSLGRIGIEGGEVYTIPYGDVCAVAHECSVEPYSSQDEEVVKSWVQAHQNVVDAAMQQFGTVLPLGFDAIIKGGDRAGPEQIVQEWLRDDYEELKEKMDRVRSKREFGLQIFYDPKIVGDSIVREDEGIRRLKEEMAQQNQGMAYMLKHKLERALKEEMERRAEQHFRDFYAAIKARVEDIKVEKLKKHKEKTMLMNLSCLVAQGKVEDLGNELGRIANMDGFSVRFTGPWAPYSFM
ncbi:gas vesicle protein GvpL [Chloroflexota bacterium]